MKARASVARSAEHVASICVDRLQWRELIASEHGPASPTTRLVLLVLSLHMNTDRSRAWPSQDKLVTRSGLGQRTVKLGIALARRAGWLVVNRVRRGDNRPEWRSNEYTATVPAHLATLIQNYDVLYNRPVDSGAAGAPDTPSSGAAGAPIRGRLLQNQGRLLPLNPIRESDIESGAENGRASNHHGRLLPLTKEADDLKNRFSKKKKNRAKELRHSVGATLVRPIDQRVLKLKLTDDELAAKVRKFRDAGLDDARIKQSLSSQAEESQLTRALEKAAR